MRENLKDKKRIVFKVGSSTLTHKETGALDLVKMEKFDLELILNEAHARHRAALLSDIFLIIARFLKFV